MLRSRPERATGLVLVIGLILGVDSSAQAQLAPIDPRLAPTSLAVPLRLEVFVNGVPTHLVEPFVLSADRHLLAKPSDLEDIGLKVPGFPDPLLPIDLASLPDVSYRFDQPAQRIGFKLNDAARLAHVYDARPLGLRGPLAEADWGTIVNYSLFGTSTNRLGTFPKFSGLNTTFDARAFGPYGEVTQTGIVGNTVLSNETSLRLDTTYSYSDPNLLLTGRVGDTISGGLVWTRPIRYGGLQIQRDFGLRSDLVTQPLPNISGSAAVPSTVDVFVNSVKTYSQDVAPGPYSITNLPVVSGSGTAHVVVTDATGRSTDTAVPFFTAPTLLARGLSDFSVDAGFARRNYGLLSNDYDRRPLGSAIGRYGMTDWLTLEGHGEGGAGLVNLGAGAVGRAGRWGTISFAGSGSHVGGQTGAQVYAGYDVEFGGFNIDASSQRHAKELQRPRLDHRDDGRAEPRLDVCDRLLRARSEAAARARSHHARDSAQVRCRLLEHERHQSRRGERHAFAHPHGILVAAAALRRVVLRDRLH